MVANGIERYTDEAWNALAVLEPVCRSGDTMEQIADVNINGDLAAAIYVVQLVASDGEYFTKVGITKTFSKSCETPFEGLATRAKGFYPYTVAACEVRVGTPAEVLAVERSMLIVLRAVKGNLYKPEVAFKGSKTECFRLAYVKMKRLLQSQWDCRNDLMN